MFRKNYEKIVKNVLSKIQNLKKEWKPQKIIHSVHERVSVTPCVTPGYPLVTPQAGEELRRIEEKNEIQDR